MDPRTILLGTVDLEKSGREQPIRATAYLARGPVVHLEGAGAPSNLDAFGNPGEGRAKDALADVARKEEAVGFLSAGGFQEAKLGEA